MREAIERYFTADPRNSRDPLKYEGRDWPMEVQPNSHDAGTTGRAVHIAAAVVVVAAFLAGQYAGTVQTEKRIASACLTGEWMRVGRIQMKCPDVPGWRDR